MKKLISLILIISLSFAVFQISETNVKAALVYGDFEYEIVGQTNQNVVITKYLGAGGVVSIPSYIESRPVIQVNSIFENSETVVQVTIPSTVLGIGPEAFINCKNLVAFYMAEGAAIGSSPVFAGCPKLKTVVLSSKTNKISTNAFFNCSGLENFNIPVAVTIIDTQAFYGCSALTGLILPDKLIEIKNNAFSGCSKLELMQLPKFVTTVGEGAFSGCTSLSRINVSEENSAFSSVDGVLMNKSKTSVLCYPYAKTGVYNVLQGITEIGQGAFGGCNNLSGIVFPQGLTNIKDSAFVNCMGLTRVEFPDSLTNIGNYAFFNCANLSFAKFFGNAPVVGSSVFKYSAAGFMVGYVSGKTGFTNPWNDYVTTTGDPQNTSSPTPLPTISPTPTPKPTVTPRPTVTPIKVTGVKLNKTSISIFKGKTYKLIATVYPSKATNKKVTWKSGIKSIATVSSKGVIKGIKKGKVYIYVYTVDGKKTAKCRVTVK